MEESIEASRKLSHEFKAESKADDEHHRLFFKWIGKEPAGGQNAKHSEKYGEQ